MEIETKKHYRKKTDCCIRIRCHSTDIGGDNIQSHDCGRS